MATRTEDNFYFLSMRKKSLLKSKQVAYEEIDVSIEAEKRYEMVEKSNGVTSVPQIFIGGQHIGGCDDMFALDANDLAVKRMQSSPGKSAVTLDPPTVTG